MGSTPLGPPGAARPAARSGPTWPAVAGGAQRGRRACLGQAEWSCATVLSGTPRACSFGAPRDPGARRLAGRCRCPSAHGACTNTATRRKKRSQVHWPPSLALRSAQRRKTLAYAEPADFSGARVPRGDRLQCDSSWCSWPCRFAMGRRRGPSPCRACHCQQSSVLSWVGVTETPSSGPVSSGLAPGLAVGCPLSAAELTVAP